MAKDEKQLLEEFQAKIDKGIKIEPKDWMPENYRKQLIRMMSQHAHSEIVGMLPGRELDYKGSQFAQEGDIAG